VIVCRVPLDDLSKEVAGNVPGIIASFFWGTVGFAFAIYGWRQQSMVPLFGGIGVIIVSYFCIESVVLMSLFSIAIIAAIFWLKKR
jgi:hypothetical protein